MPIVEQGVGSTHYSQFFNFDGSEDRSYLLPSEDTSSSPSFMSSSKTWIDSGLSTRCGLNIEPGTPQTDSLSCPFGSDQTKQCRLEPTYLEMISPPDVEEWDAVSRLFISADPHTKRIRMKRSPIRKISDDSKPIPKHKEETEKKLRGGRGQRAASDKGESAHVRAKQAHSVVERRYRDNLNEKIVQLHRTLITLESTSRLSGIPTHNIFTSREYRRKFRKSDVLVDAMNYVHQTEVEMRHMSDEITRLNDRLKPLENLAKCEDCTLFKQILRLQRQQFPEQ